jgi:hypothetical protein
MLLRRLSMAANDILCKAWCCSSHCASQPHYYNNTLLGPYLVSRSCRLSNRKLYLLTPTLCADTHKAPHYSSDGLTLLCSIMHCMPLTLCTVWVTMRVRHTL